MQYVWPPGLVPDGDSAGTSEQLEKLDASRRGVGVGPLGAQGWLGRTRPVRVTSGAAGRRAPRAVPRTAGTVHTRRAAPHATHRDPTPGAEPRAVTLTVRRALRESLAEQSRAPRGREGDNTGQVNYPGDA